MITDNKRKRKKKGVSAYTVNGSSQNGKGVGTDAHQFLQFLQRANMNQQFSREALARAFAVGGGHKVDEACGYPRELTFIEYKFLIDREGIARRANSLYPDECFSQAPHCYENESVEGDEQTPFEKGWTSLTLNYPVLNKLHRLDVVSGYGHYGVMIIGTNDNPDLSKPFPGFNELTGKFEGEPTPHELLYLMPFSEGEVQLGPLATAGARYSRPLYYNIQILNPQVPGFSSSDTKRVHWTRCIHVADGCTSSDLIGVPRLKSVYNYIMNIRKVMGGSAEMFWMGGFPGTSFEVPPELVNAGELDEEKLTKQIEDYISGFRRYLALSGVEAKQLLPNIASPSEHIDIQMQAMCISLEIPLRIFTGSEEARLASMNDSESWNRRIHRRQDIHVTPHILRPTVERFVQMGILPKPEKPIQIKWPDVYAVSESDRADITGKLVRALGEYITTGAFKLVPPQQFFTMWMDLTTPEAEAVITACQAAIKSKDFDFLDKMFEMQAKPAGFQGQPGSKSNTARRRPALGAKKKVKIGTNEIVVNSPVRCRRGGKPGFKYGDEGVCYTYTEGDDESKKLAKKKARTQGALVEVTKSLHAMNQEAEPDANN